MVKQNKKIHASTQKFTEIYDIKDHVVLLENKNACSVIEVQATNFTLLSAEEQQAKLYAYASLLNSLSFQIQILIRNKPVDVSTYIKRINIEIQKFTTTSTPADLNNEKRVQYIKQYRDYVQQLIKVNTVLDKKFYIVLSFSPLEIGASLTAKKEDILLQAKIALRTKAESLLTEFGRLALRAKILEQEELVELFYDIYNQAPGSMHNAEDLITPAVVKTR